MSLEDLSLEVVRKFLEEQDRAFIDSNAVVTEDDAREFLEGVRKKQEFENMMWEFVNDVITRTPSEWLIVMNKDHLCWIRSFHQIHQRLGLYEGRKREPGLEKKNPPKFDGVPILIDETADRPRLE